MTFITGYLLEVAVCLVIIGCSFEARASPASPKQYFVCTTEEHRPQYHFSAKENWINDPNGMVYYDGIYHLFYQYHPNSTVWGPMYWGHATSRNLATWEELPIALAPNELGAIFSGSSVVDTTNTTGFKQPNGTDPIVAIYTSASGNEYQVQRQSIAYSLDNGASFTQYEGNPVLNSTDIPDFRDPKVFYYDNRWIMSLAVSNKIEFYSSPDLKTWTKLSEFGNNPPVGNHDGVWECPDLIPIGVDISDKLTIELWVLLVSINPGGPNGGSATQYFIGNLTRDGANNLRFDAYPWSQNQWLDWGPDNYAGVTFSNEPKGRPIYIGWMSNWDYARQTPNKAHRGQMTIPRQLDIRVLDHAAGQYRLTSNPVSDLDIIKDPLQYFEQTESITVAPQARVDLSEKAYFKTSLMELGINLIIKDNAQFSICAHNDVNEETCFGYNATRWYLDRSKSGNTNFDQNFQNTVRAHAAREITDESINIRIFLDVSSIEVFADDGLTTMTALHFPSKPFDRLYIKNLSPVGSPSSITVSNFSISGIRCWFPEQESNAGGDDDDSGSSIPSINLAFLSLINFIFVFRQYLTM